MAITDQEEWNTKAKALRDKKKAENGAKLGNLGHQPDKLQALFEEDDPN
jgi:hypothetical protein